MNSLKSTLYNERIIVDVEAVVTEDREDDNPS